jgi:hypothetical protein
VFSPAAQHEILQLVDSNPAVVNYRDAMLQGPRAMRLLYQSIRMARAMLSDAESVPMMRQTRSTLKYVQSLATVGINRSGVTINTTNSYIWPGQTPSGSTAPCSTTNSQGYIVKVTVNYTFNFFGIQRLSPRGGRYFSRCDTSIKDRTLALLDRPGETGTEFAGHSKSSAVTINPAIHVSLLSREKHKISRRARESVHVYGSRTLIAQLPPLPGSNCSTVFAKDNSPWGVSVSKNKLSLQSGMQYSPRSLYSSTGLVALPRTYLHQSPQAGPSRFNRQYVIVATTVSV